MSAWGHTEEKPAAPLDLTKEQFWISGYVDSQDRWTKDYAAMGYECVGQFDLGDGSTLYRFKPVEGLGQTHNVVIKKAVEKK